MIRILSFFAVLAAPVLAHAHGQHRIDVDGLEYRNPAGNDLAETSVAWGDVRSGGEVYATHARALDGASMPPHTHPNTLRIMATSRTVFAGIGESYDEDAPVGCTAGSFFVTEAGVPRFIVAQDGVFSVLDHGVGPGVIALIEQPDGAPVPDD